MVFFSRPVRVDEDETVNKGRIPINPGPVKVQN